MIMDSFDAYKSLPIGSLVTRNEEEEAVYLKELVELPPGLVNLIMSSKTSGYIRGITKATNLPLDSAPVIAFVVLRVVFGKISLAQLGATLSTELKLPNDVAQAMAKDIEEELFGPVMMELDQYLKSKQSGGQQAPPSPPVIGPNLLDLRGKGSARSDGGPAEVVDNQ